MIRHSFPSIMTAFFSKPGGVLDPWLGCSPWGHPRVGPLASKRGELSLDTQWSTSLGDKFHLLGLPRYFLHPGKTTQGPLSDSFFSNKKVWCLPNGHEAPIRMRRYFNHPDVWKVIGNFTTKVWWKISSLYWGCWVFFHLGMGWRNRSAQIPPFFEDFGRCTMELYRLGWSGRRNRPISPIILDLPM